MGQQDVLRFQVSVDDPFGLQDLHGAGNLLQENPDGVLAQRAFGCTHIYALTHAVWRNILFIRLKINLVTLTLEVVCQVAAIAVLGKNIRGRQRSHMREELR